MSYILRFFLLFCAAGLMGALHPPSPSQAQDAPFITIWDTENPGESDDDQIIIPGEGTDYTVVWEEVGNQSNDGSEMVSSGDTTLTLPKAGLYRVKISGDFTRIHFGKYELDEGDPQKIELVTQWGDIKWSTMNEAFYRASNVDLSADDTSDLSRVTSVSHMFFDAESLIGSGSAIGSWSTGNITDMKRMFAGADDFNQDISDWDVSSVVDMNNMFGGADSFNQDIAPWDVSNVENMRAMFAGAVSFNQDIGGWKVGNVTTMAAMFSGAESFNQNIGEWDVSKVTDMTAMFSNARSFNQDISLWDVSSVKDMPLMLRGASSFNQDIGRWDVSGVTDSGPSNGMGKMLDDTGLSAANYDHTLVGWATHKLDGNVVLSASGLQYCNSGPFRTHIIERFSWTVKDGGQKEGCPEVMTASDANQISSDDRFHFEGLATTVVFSELTGGGRMTIARFEESPRNVEGISESNISQYRLVVAAGGITLLEDAKLRFAVSKFGGIEQPGKVTVYKRPQPGYGAFDSLPTSIDDNGTSDDISDDTLSATVTEDFGEFVFASDSNELPVELANFKGSATKDKVRLTWKTASETNNAGFEVQQKSTESTDWQNIGFVKSKAESGSSTEPQSYRYIAEGLPVGTHKFRLKQVDLDGSSTFSQSVNFDIQMQRAVQMTAPSPNPVFGSATLSFAVEQKTEATVSLYNVLGQRVETLYEGTPPLEESQQLRIDASNLSSGLYVIRLEADGKTQARRLTVVQ